MNWEQTLRRSLRLTSRGGVKVDVLLPPGRRLAHADVLAEGLPAIGVCVEEIDVLAIQVVDPVLRGRLAFHLGNLHVAAQITPQSILTPDDGPARAAADLFGLSFAVESARFYPEPVTLDRVFRFEGKLS
ncbi:MAG: UreE urease accessory protein C-terminal domain [Phycisphaerales bacterium]|nr:UreE urease accessory protein C-terminal domain [Phycisphaerales bacterium]